MFSNPRRRPATAKLSAYPEPVQTPQCGSQQTMHASFLKHRLHSTSLIWKSNAFLWYAMVYFVIVYEHSTQFMYPLCQPLQTPWYGNVHPSWSTEAHWPAYFSCCHGRFHRKFRTELPGTQCSTASLDNLTLGYGYRTKALARTGTCWQDCFPGQHTDWGRSGSIKQAWKLGEAKKCMPAPRPVSWCSTDENGPSLMQGSQLGGQHCPNKRNRLKFS